MPKLIVMTCDDASADTIRQALIGLGGEEVLPGAGPDPMTAPEPERSAAPDAAAEEILSLVRRLFKIHDRMAGSIGSDSPGAMRGIAYDIGEMAGLFKQLRSLLPGPPA